MVGLLDALGERRRSSSATTGAHRSPGTRRCCVRTASAPSRPERSVPAAGAGARRRTVMPQTDDTVVLSALLPEARRRRGRARARCARAPSAASCTRLRRRAERAADGLIGMVPRDGGFLEPHGSIRRRLPPWLERRRPRLLRGRVRAHRLPRRPQLVPQHRPQLGAAGAVRRRAGHGAGALRRRRPRPRGHLQGHGPAIPNLAKSCRTCAGRSCCRAAATGPSRSARTRSTRP